MSVVATKEIVVAEETDGTVKISELPMSNIKNQNQVNNGASVDQPIILDDANAGEDWG